MNRIFYGLAGEGLGHASRTLSVIDAMPDCEFHVFTFGKAYQFFQNMGYPHLHEIDGIMFPYRKGKISYTKLIKRILNYKFRGLKENIQIISEAATELEPKVFITDFEPSMPRAARKFKAKDRLISVDNQHRFVFCELSDLPSWGLWSYAKLVGLTTKLLVTCPSHAVISTFHFDVIKTNWDNVTLTNGLIRNSVEQTQTSNDGFILVYLRDSVSDKILSVLATHNQSDSYVVYGASDTITKRGCPDNFEFKPLSPSFVDDLVSCDRIIATAGNQLISEARYCQKPILAIPEPMQYEQYVNAHYVEKIGLGMSCFIDDLTSAKVNSFTKFKSTASHEENGVHKVTEVIRRYL